MRPITYKKANGSIVVLWPTAELLATGGDLSKYVPASAEIIDIKPTELPTRLFQGAWESTDLKSITVNLDKAKLLAHDMRRALRDRLMAPLDKLATSPIQAVKDKAMADKVVIYNNNARLQADIEATSAVDDLEALIRNTNQ